MTVTQYPPAESILTTLTWVKTAGSAITLLSGNDDTGQTLAYTPGQEQVYLNGVLLTRGTDYAATTGNTITGLSGITVGDNLKVYAASNYSLAAFPAASITGSISNTQLANNAITVNGVSIPLGGSVTAGAINSIVAGTGLTGGGTTGVVTIGLNPSYTIPAQSGKGGYYLTTDGVNLYWTNSNIIPGQAGNGGKYLQTDGANLTWQNITSLSNATLTNPIISSGTTGNRPSGTIGQVYFDITIQQLLKYTSFGWFPMDVYPTSIVSGGLIASDTTYYYRVFTSTGYLHLGGNLTADIFLIGGGGGGGETIGGGGGAGGVVLYSSQSLTQGSYLATVGYGGYGGYDGQNGNYPFGGNGGNTSFGSIGIAYGGQTGGGFNVNPTINPGASGGGAGSATSATLSAGSQGFSGGTSPNNGNFAPGGGGSGAVGGNSTVSVAGAGGNGTNNYSSWISAITSVMTSIVPLWSYATAGGYIAAGGGGGTRNTPGGPGGIGGYGGGGTGGDGRNTTIQTSYSLIAGTSATQNTGSGGGGGGYSNSGGVEGPGGAGGSGLIVVRYTRSQVGG